MLAGIIFFFSTAWGFWNHVFAFEFRLSNAISMMWSITDVALDIYHILVLFIHLVILVKYYELLILRKVCSFEGLLLVSSLLPSPGMLGYLFYFVAELIIERNRDISAAWLLWVALLSRVCNTIQLLNIILLSFINILKCICAHACAQRPVYIFWSHI